MVYFRKVHNLQFSSRGDVRKRTGAPYDNAIGSMLLLYITDINRSMNAGCMTISRLIDLGRNRYFFFTRIKLRVKHLET